MKFWKQNWSKGAQFPNRRHHRKFLLPRVLKQVPEGSSCIFEDFYSTIQKHPEKAGSQAFSNDIKSTSATSTSLFSTNCQLSIMFGKHVVRFQIFDSRSFFWLMCKSNLRNFNCSGHSYLRQKSQDIYNNLWITGQRWTVCWHGHANRVVVPYDLNDRIVRGFEYYQMLEIHVWSKYQHFQ